jgi:cysteine dioxygenase
MGVTSSSIRTTLSTEVFTQELRNFPSSAFTSTDQIRKFLADHPLEPASLDPYLFWDKQHYTRNLIDKTTLYEVVAICWEAGQVSSIHNHRDQNCWMAVPIGKLMVQNYRVLFQDMKAGKCRLEKTNGTQMDPDTPCAVDPTDSVHKVFNPREWNQRAVSVHIYSRPFDSCDVYSEEQQTCGTISLSYNSERGVPRPA